MTDFRGGARIEDHGETIWRGFAVVHFEDASDEWSGYVINAPVDAIAKGMVRLILGVGGGGDIFFTSGDLPAADFTGIGPFRYESERTLAREVALLKSSGGRFGPEVGAAAENVMYFLDSFLDKEFRSRVRSKQEMFILPRGYDFDVAGSGRMQLCMPREVNSSEDAQRIFAPDVADGLLEEICAALGPEASATVRSELGLTA